MTKNKKRSSNENNSGKSGPMGIDFESLKQRLREEDAFISSIIDTIPAKVYFDDEVQERITAEKHRTMDQVAKTLKRGSSGQDLSSKNKHKRARLDPSQFKSVSQIQEEEAEKDKRQRPWKSVTGLSASLTRAANIEELQKRLQERIRELQAKRRAFSEEESMEKKRLKNKMKKMKRKQKGNLQKTSKIETEQHTEAPKKEKQKLKPKPVYNKDGKIIYSKFDFVEPGEKIRESRKKKGSKNYKKLLIEAQKEKEKLEDIKKQDEDKANMLIQKNMWQRAIKKAEGVKLKDDPTLLKKSLKKQEKRKMKSAKEWQKRKESTENRMKAKQEKRKKNIQAKKQEKLDKKIKRAKKKGRIIPGF